MHEFGWAGVDTLISILVCAGLVSLDLVAHYDYFVFFVPLLALLVFLATRD